MSKKINVNIYFLIFLVSIIICILVIIFIGVIYKLKKVKKNLIIGYIYKYPWLRVKNYFISLIKVGFKNVDVVMFIKDIPQDTIEILKSIGVILYPMSNSQYLSNNCLRWEVYANYLKENKDKYNMVLHTDVRDTIFQQDVFQFYNSHKSFFGVSEEDITLDEEINKDWMLTLCNESEYNNYFANRKVICAGLVIGTPDKFIEYNNSIMKMAHGKILGDQRFLNYLVYHDNLFKNSIIIKNNYNSHIMHIAMTQRENIILDKDDNILNFNGEIASVVHQYDRHMDLIRKMNRKFNDEDFKYTDYKKRLQNKNILSKNEIIKFCFIFFIVFTIIVISIIFIKKIFVNYILMKRKKPRKAKIKYNFKNKRRKKFNTYKKIKN